MSVTASAIRTAKRVDRFTYAIRNIVAEAKKVEAAGTRVRYLNIGDPIQFGFVTPPHLIDAGIPTAILGPGSLDTAHASSEFVRIRELEVAADLYERKGHTVGLARARERLAALA